MALLKVGFEAVVEDPSDFRKGRTFGGWGSRERVANSLLFPFSRVKWFLPG